MAIEKRWAAVTPVAFTTAGTTKGKASVTSTRGFRVKMDVVLMHPTQPSLELEVKQVAGPVTLYLGPKNTRINEFSDLTAYDSQTSVYANEQSRPSIPVQEFERASYEEEPVVAKRIFRVDHFGRPYTPVSPFPEERIRRIVQVAGSSTEYFDYQLPASGSFHILQFYFGTLGGPNLNICSSTLFRHDPSVVNELPNGSLDNAEEVAAWLPLSGTFTGSSPEFSSLRAFSGVGSMRWSYAASSTALARRQLFPSPQDFSGFRFITLRTFHETVTSTTRTISLVLTSIGGGTRTYSISGTLGTVIPFNSWVPLVADLESPSAVTGIFDITRVTSVDLRMADSQNRTGTMFWDAIRFEDQIEFIDRLYSLGPTVELKAPYATVLPAGSRLYIVTKNGNTGNAEFSTVVFGVIVP